jgi:hypothetical protein
MRTDYENKQLTAYENKAQPYVLVAVPMKPDLSPKIFKRCMAAVGSLTYPHRDGVVHNGPFEPDPSRACSRQAAARNRVLEDGVKPRHTHVLIMDADIVGAPADLIERLLEVSMTDIVAPHVYTEKLKPHQPGSFKNGGWFYDTGAFIQDGKTRNMWQPDLPGVQEMDSVGCCYLMPADIWRKGVRYEPVGHEIDHLSFMRGAKALGYRIWATSEIVVEHAYLPKYGEEWHVWP